MAKEIKILFVRPFKSSFIENDLEILKDNFSIRNIDFVFHYKKCFETFKSFIRLIKGLLWADLCFSWFAENHSFYMVKFTKFFRTKSIVVIGGFEVANGPEINYGSLIDKKAKKKVKYVIENADLILAVSKFNKEEVLKFTTPKLLKLIYNGVDCNKFRPGGKKENIVVTTGFISEGTITRKGLETFVKTAKLIPDVKFLIVGKSKDNSVHKLKSIAPNNVEFTGYVSDDKLLDILQRAKVYCQISYYESFGIALAEAMLCECVPVVTNKGALPEVVGETGFYVEYGNVVSTANGIKSALISSNGKSARKRVLELYNLKLREDKIKNIINNLV